MLIQFCLLNIKIYIYFLNILKKTWHSRAPDKLSDLRHFCRSVSVLRARPPGWSPSADQHCSSLGNFAHSASSDRHALLDNHRPWSSDSMDLMHKVKFSQTSHVSISSTSSAPHFPDLPLSLLYCMIIPQHINIFVCLSPLNHNLLGGRDCICFLCFQCPEESLFSEWINSSPQLLELQFRFLIQ